MGKIIRNGIPYSGSSNSARSINYDNSNSGLEATTAQAAVDELNKKIADIDVSGLSNIVYLTKAQYEALPDDKLTNGVEYRITDAHTTNRIDATDITYGDSNVKVVVDTLNENVDELSNSLGIDIKIIDGVPHWSERGADSWSPFSSGSITEIEIVPLVPILTSNTGSDGGEASASSEHDSASGYDAYKAFDGQDTTVWHGSTTVYTDSWLQYKYAVPTKVQKFEMIPVYWAWSDEYKDRYTIKGALRVKTYKYQASNDGTNWVDLTDNIIAENNHTGEIVYSDKFGTMYKGIKCVDQVTKNEGYYMYYRVFLIDKYDNDTGFAIESLQFYGYQMEALIPVMTSNTAPYGEVSASSEVPGYPNYAAFTALTEDITSDIGWLATDNPSYWQYKFENPTNVTAIRLLAMGDRNFKIGSFQGSNDGVKFVDLPIDITDIAQTNVKYMINVDNNEKYLIYRLNCIKNATQTPGIKCLQFYAAPEGTSGGGTIIKPKFVDIDFHEIDAWIADYDLTVIPEYQQLEYGKNFIVSPLNVNTTLSSVIADMTYSYDKSTGLLTITASSNATWLRFTKIRVMYCISSSDDTSGGCDLQMSWEKALTQDSGQMEFKGNFKKMSVTYTANNTYGGLRVVDGNTDTILISLASTSTTKTIELDLSTDYIILKGVASDQGLEFECLISNIKFE